MATKSCVQARGRGMVEEAQGKTDMKMTNNQKLKDIVMCLDWAERSPEPGRTEDLRRMIAVGLEICKDVRLPTVICPLAATCTRDEEGCTRHCVPHEYDHSCDYEADGCPPCVRCREQPQEVFDLHV